MNQKSNVNNKKNPKGFYAALGVSAVMIGSACYFSYDQNKKTAEGRTPAAKQYVTEAPVDNKQNGIPKTTTAYKVTTTSSSLRTIVTTTTTQPAATLPAAEIIKDEPPENAPASAEVPSETPVNTVRLENPKPPLNDISEVLSPFSAGELVKNETTGSWQTHNGTDIKAEVGDEVYVISSGEVVEVKNDNLWGVTVLVDHHNGYKSKYCGLGTDLSVQAGDTLAGGNVIGVVGTTSDIESSAAPHLHIELTHNGSFVDPIAEINRDHQ